MGEWGLFDTACKLALLQEIWPPCNGGCTSVVVYIMVVTNCRRISPEWAGWFSMTFIDCYENMYTIVGSGCIIKKISLSLS